MIYTGRLAPILVLSSARAGAPTAYPLPAALHSTRDLGEFGGAGRIAGAIMVDSTPDYPVLRRVRLFDRRDNRLVREVWSDPTTGAYKFEFINPDRRYVVIAYDHAGVYNAEIRDNITPVLMP